MQEICYMWSRKVELHMWRGFMLYLVSALFLVDGFWWHFMLRMFIIQLSGYGYNKIIFLEVFISIFFLWVGFYSFVGVQQGSCLSSFTQTVRLVRKEMLRWCFWTTLASQECCHFLKALANFPAYNDSYNFTHSHHHCNLSSINYAVLTW